MPIVAVGGVAAILAIWVLARGMNNETTSDDETWEPTNTGWDRWEWRTKETIGTKDNHDFDIQEFYYHNVDTDPNPGWRPKTTSHRYRPVIINNETGLINSFLGITDDQNNRNYADTLQALQSRWDAWGSSGGTDPTPTNPNNPDPPSVNPTPNDPLGGGGGGGLPFAGSDGGSSPSVNGSAVGTPPFGGW